MRHLFFTAAAVVLACCAALPAAALSSDDATVAERLLAQVAPENATEAAIAAAANLKSMQPNGSWADIDYNRCGRWRRRQRQRQTDERT